MRTTTLRRGLAAAALVPLLAGLTACGDDDKDDDSDSTGSSGTQACGTLPTANPQATLPAGFPKLSDQVLYEPSTQGATKIVFALVDESNFVEVRDEIVEKLKDAGYTIVGTDQESVEAEAEFKKGDTEEGTIKVEPFCKGYVSVRYKFLG
jgi:hypothetical protein